MATEWMIREDQLDTDQSDFVNNRVKKPGNIWIQGFAGSGKSVLLIHSMLEVIRKEPKATICIVVYTLSLMDMFETGMSELKFSRKIPVMTYFQFRKGNEKYDYIFCDEVQDLPEDVVREMNRRSKKVIVAGDSNQSIYEDTIESDQIEKVLSAEPFTLSMIHRLSRSIIAIVQSILPTMNIWGAKRDNSKIDVEVRYCKAISSRREVEYVWQEASKAVRFNDTAVILLPSHKKINSFIKCLCDLNDVQNWITKTNQYNKPDYDSLNQYFKQHKINLEYVGNGYGSFQNAVRNKNVILMTYHSSKGMDFENVFMPFCENPIGLNSSKEETVFMVALTRSRKNLYISHSDSPYYLVNKIIKNCRQIDVEKELTPVQNVNNKFGF